MGPCQQLSIPLSVKNMNRQEISSLAFNVQRSMETNALLADIGGSVKDMYAAVVLVVCLGVITMLLVAGLYCVLCSVTRQARPGDTSSSAPSVMMARFPNLNMPSIANSREFVPDAVSSGLSVSEQIRRRRARVEGEEVEAAVGEAAGGRA